LCRGIYVPLPTEQDHFQLTATALAPAVSARTKAIILTSPGNPTGCIYNEESLAAVCALAREHDLFVLCDDVYSQLVYTDHYRSFASFRELRDRIILIESFSKPYAMTGWRVGYLCADAPLLAELQKVNQNCVVSVSSFIQHACVTALASDVHEMREAYRRRRDYVLERLNTMGLFAERPEGAFYVFPSIAAFGMDSATFCRRMIAEAGVGAVPGSCFGTEGYFRISYCCSDDELRIGMDRMEAFLHTLR
ncbi:MAG: aminotransferase class I/II-fold pyridoxal phosphate-dependent enzyme, partial [Pygmaiobacter sp.]